MKVKIVTPIVVDEADLQRRAKGYKCLRKDTQIKFVSPKHGPTYLDYYYEHVWSDYGVLCEGEKAEKEGYDALISDCVFEPAAKALKGKLNIPVIAPLETAIHVAATLGKKFSILALNKNMAELLKERVKEHGLGDKLASVRSLDITFEEFLGEHFQEVKIQKLEKAGRVAVEQDGADVIVIGCTSTYGQEVIQKKLGVPVIEPGVLAAKMAEVFIDMNLTQSKKAYPSAAAEYEKRYPLIKEKK